MVGWVILVLVLVFLAVLLLRAAAFRPEASESAAAQPCSVDGDAAVAHLAEMVRIATVSSDDPKAFDEAKFGQFRDLLRKLYPHVFASCGFEQLDHTEILFKWSGKSSAAPAVLMAHYDVVAVEESRWKHPPFCGEIFEGELWGRGTLDTKITLMGILESADRLIAEGFVPENDIYMAFAGDEEVNGTGAQSAVKTLKDRGIRPAIVVDEGGAVVSGIFPGVKEPMAVIGIGEKGLANMRLTAKSEGGHASHPPMHSAVGVLSRAIVRCEAHPFSARLVLPVRAMFETAGRHAPFGFRILFANLWCFGGLLARMAGKLGNEMNAMMRTTMAFTMAEGSKQPNVMPNEASAVVNLRILGGDTVDSAAQHLRSAIADPNVEVRVLEGSDPSPYADLGSSAWKTVSAAAAETWKGALVCPYLMIACSDSRHFSEICGNVFKFSAMELSGEQRGLIHNDNERIAVNKVPETVEFFTRLIRKL